MKESECHGSLMLWVCLQLKQAESWMNANGLMLDNDPNFPSCVTLITKNFKAPNTLFVHQNKESLLVALNACRLYVLIR